ncbi:prolipoprotein diacylglyceryl transferase [Tistrella bauzanensis]|uniref:Phosphatidylglycerol--prolipoprotein diacylglyceryl transferase n=1 Tax=Tistrella bauzanensis TaxID=657419 RepID=A0ABQ1IB07_9PROT|nr:prolipoprotein diacylglyceryl transferase [Tistrella bauzanensis]GGB31245.1 prolipoprotein diacylglyceryl transferase [Tistrella bauzanensis]
MTGLPFPDIDPVAIAIGPIAIRWYALAYIAGLLLGWRYVVALARRHPLGLDERAIDDLLVWVTFGVILGGRFGYVLFYRPDYYVDHLLEIPMVWKGGMSFHGGLLGVAVSMYLFARAKGVAPLTVGDLVAAAAPIGLFFGRIANFINGELWGRPTDLPWGIIFPMGGPEPRHPSQIYEALLEGALLFAVLWVIARKPSTWARPGLLAGIFLIGYAITRSIAELFRMPDAFLGFLAAGLTMGQLLSLPMFLIGVYLVLQARGRDTGAGTGRRAG